MTYAELIKKKVQEKINAGSNQEDWMLTDAQKEAKMMQYLSR